MRQKYIIHMNRLNTKIEVYPSGVRLLTDGGPHLVDIDIQLLGKMVWEWNQANKPNSVDNYVGPEGTNPTPDTRDEEIRFLKDFIKENII
jgi:hypothetical protein